MTGDTNRPRLKHAPSISSVHRTRYEALDPPPCSTGVDEQTLPAPQSCHFKLRASHCRSAVRRFVLWRRECVVRWSVLFGVLWFGFEVVLAWASDRGTHCNEGGGNERVTSFLHPATGSESRKTRRSFPHVAILLSPLPPRCRCSCAQSACACCCSQSVRKVR